MTQVFLVDDHRALSDGIKAALQQTHDITVVGQATDGNAAIEQLEKMAQLPHIILSDIEMKGMHGLNLLAEITQRWPQIRFVLLSQHTQFHTKAIKAGAAGYLLKESGVAEIIKGIRSVATGKNYSDPYFGIEDRTHHEQYQPTPEFTTRELQIICLIVDECTTRDIAEKLNIPFSAVETYARNIRRKTKTTNIAGIVKYALQNKLC